MERSRAMRLSVGLAGALGLLAAAGGIDQAAAQAQQQAETPEEDVFPIGAEGEPGKEYKRKIDPSSLQVPDGYEVEVFVRDLNYPTDLTFGPNGEAYVAESGAHFYGTNPKKAPPARILKILPGGKLEVLYDNNVSYKAIQDADTVKNLPEGLIGPVEGLTYNERNGLLYVAHRGRYSTLNPRTGEFKTIIDGLPAWGIFHNSKVIFDPQGRMVFEVSAQENAGLVDKPMAEVLAFYNKPGLREIPCEDVTLTGEDYVVKNYFSKKKGDKVQTGVYVPFGVQTEPGQTVKGEFWCNGAFYRADPDGSNPERIAWGLRDPYHYAYSPAGRLIATNNGGEAFPNRPIFDDWDTVYEIKDGAWYGWPDYYSGVPVTDDRFKKPNDPNYKKGTFDHQFALTEETRRRLLKGAPLPPPPLVRIEPLHVGAQGFVFGREDWGMDPENQIILAEFGTLQFITTKGPNPPGFMLSIVDLRSGERVPFITNSQRPASASPEPGKGEPKGGGFERPLRPVWGPDGALYLVDFGRLDSFPEKQPKGKKRFAWPNTGVIWKITKTGATAQAGQAAETPPAQSKRAAAEQAAAEPVPGPVAAADVYAEWAGEDGELSVAEWDAAVDQRFGENAVNLAAPQWDDDGNGVISQEEFAEALAQTELLSRLEE
jgi:glucose/arabinose dehydrogenase